VTTASDLEMGSASGVGPQVSALGRNQT